MIITPYSLHFTTVCTCQLAQNGQAANIATINTDYQDEQLKSSMFKGVWNRYTLQIMCAM